MKKFFFLFLILTLSITYSTEGKKLYCRNYTINDGLPSNTINDIYKDSRGFIWIGTNAGLVRFDGTNFKVYNSLNGLAGDKVVSISESNNGEIWVGFKNNGLTNIFGSRLYSLNITNGLASNTINKLFYSKNFNLLFIGTNDGLSVINDGKITNIQKVIIDEDYKLNITNFIETKEYVYVFTKGGKTYKYNPFLENLSPRITNRLHTNIKLNSAYISSKIDTLINYQNTLEILNKNFQRILNIGLVTDYIEDLNGNIWISSIKSSPQCNSGLYQYHNGEIKKFNKLLGIDSKDILSIEFDEQENILWIGTKKDGVYLIPGNNFMYYNYEDLKTEDLDIIDLFAQDDILWICSNNSLIKKYQDERVKTYAFEKFEKTFNSYAKYKLKQKYQYLIDQNGSYKKYKDLINQGIYPFSNPYLTYKNGETDIIQANSLYKPLKYEVITTKKFTSLNGIIGVKGDYIWIGSNVGIFMLNTKNDQLQFYDTEGNNFTKYSFDKYGRLLASSWNNLLIYPNIEKESYALKYNTFKDNAPVNVNKILSVNDQIWFSTSDHGLYVFADNKFTSTYNRENFTTDAFNDICTDHYNNIIAGSNNGNIYVVELKEDTIISKFEISSKKGIKGTTIRWVYCPEKDKLYIGTNLGINILNLKTLYSSGIIDIEYINKEHGLIDYSGQVAILDSLNNLWIGTNSLLIKTKKENVNSINSNDVNYYIESIDVNEKELELTEYTENDGWNLIPTKPIILPYYKNTISFNINMIHYLDPNSILTSYKLEGFMNNWSKVNKNHKIGFQNLPSGDYILKIKIFNRTYLESSQELSIKFKINHPYWKKWYFIILGIIGLLGITWSIVLIRTNSVKKRERVRLEIAERITEFEMKALRAQMNPHFIFNAINSIQNYMLDNDVDAALNHLSDFAKLIRITLDNVSKKKVELEEELNYLKYYLNLEKMRFDKNFEIEINLPKEINSRKIMIPPMVIQPYIENAIKYGFVYKTNNAKIKLDFSITEDEILHCIIEDNGIGRKKSKELSRKNKTSKSKATYITNERLVLLDQTEKKKGYKIETIDLYDEYGLATGTKVLINIPL